MSHTTKTVCFDFDGVIHAYSKGWHNGSIYDDPIPGALEYMAEMSRNYYVVIYTVRKQANEINTWMRYYMDKAHLSFNFTVDTTKRPAAVYLDDHAVHFNGSWPVAKRKIMELLEKAPRELTGTPVV